ncbi:MFS transporter [Jatrophihabitans sp. DSM 45814]
MTAATPADLPRSRAGAFTALAIPLFRALWLAEFAGDLGNWMQTVGAQWVIVNHPDAVLLAAMIVAAGRLPMLVLAVPAGALADLLDRRRLLLLSQVAQAVIATALAVESLAGQLGPVALLVYTVLLGLGSAVSVITFQSLMPQIVPVSQFSSAVAMAQVNLNIARVIGPPIGGLIVAITGPSGVFVLDACSYVVFALVLVFAKIPEPSQVRFTGTFQRAVTEGLALIRRSIPLRRILLHSFVVTVPCSAVWALLPALASRRLDVGATGYGLLLAAVGIGSIFGVIVLPVIDQFCAAGTTLLVGNLATAAMLALLGLTDDPAAAGAALFGFGISWLVVQTRLGASIQVAAPDAARARTISVFQSVRLGGQGIGALAWGGLAQVTSVIAAFGFAAGSLAVGAFAILWWPLLPENERDSPPLP